MTEPTTAACPRCGGFDHELCSSDGRAVRVPTTTAAEPPPPKGTDLPDEKVRKEQERAEWKAEHEK